MTRAFVLAVVIAGLATVQAVVLGALLGAVGASAGSIAMGVMLAVAGTGVAGVAGWMVRPTRSPAQTSIVSRADLSARAENDRRDSRMRELLADLAHDVRTPLASLKLGLGNLPDGQEVPALRAEVEHLDGMFSNVASMLQLEATSIPLARRELDLAPLVERVVLRLAVLASDRGVELHASTDAATDVIAKVDPVAFEQMLGNLVSNAVKFCEANVAVLLDIDEDDAVIRVLDDGPGVATVDRPKVLQRRFRAQAAVDRGRPGQGLGLAIAHALAEKHRGRISLRPGPDGGTSAELRLPRVRRAPQTISLEET